MTDEDTCLNILLINGKIFKTQISVVILLNVL